MSYYRTLPISNDKNLRAYVIGLAIGDGNLSFVNKTVRLRISCDNKYPILKDTIITSLQKLFPKNKVGSVKNISNCTDIYLYSNQLEKLLGWKVGLGSKFRQNVSTPKWILDSKEYFIPYLKGLIETDGSIYMDRGYKMVIFSTIIEKLATEVQELMTSLGFKSHFYKIGPPRKPRWNQQTKYQVRLSKDVQKFLDIVQPDKS